jgi:hypothetical protein
MNRLLLLILLLLLAASPVPLSAGPGQASAPDTARIRAIVDTLTGGGGIGPDSRAAPRPSTTGYVLWLEGRLSRHLAPVGGTVSLRSFDPGFTTVGGDSIRDPYTNVMGHVPGTLPGRPGFYILGAHLDATSRRDPAYDDNWSTHAAPGADDNGSGVAALLETARVLGENRILPGVHVLFVLFDGEEQQVPEPDLFLLGAKVMAGMDLDSLETALGPMYGFVNLDMVAFNPFRNEVVVLTNTTSRWLADQIIDAAAGIPDFSFPRTVQGLTFSDHGPFWAEGRDAILLIEDPDIIDHNPFYHRDTDTFANTYSRGGEQVAKAAEAVLALTSRWVDQGGASGLTVTSEDIRVTRGQAVDASEVAVGDSTEIVVGVTNRADSATPGWGVELDLRIDGRIVRTFPYQAGPEVLPPGGRASVSVPWIPTEEEKAAVTIHAVLVGATADTSTATMANRIVAVSSGSAEVLRAYVYPNPTADPATAILHYELSREGPLRLRFMDITGRILDSETLSYDPAFPDPDVDVGVAERSLGELFDVQDLAPGVYFLRLEQLDPETTDQAAVRVIKIAVLR